MPGELQERNVMKLPVSRLTLPKKKPLQTQHISESHEGPTIVIQAFEAHEGPAGMPEEHKGNVLIRTQTLLSSLRRGPGFS